MCLVLIAHDEKKPDLIFFAEERQDDLERFKLMATGTAGQRPIDVTGLDIKRKQSGPPGNDMQIGAGIANEICDDIVFLRDPLTTQPHEPDITALLHIYGVHRTSLTTNLVSADTVPDKLTQRLGGEE